MELADSLVADFDVAELMHRLVTRCIELLEVDAAGLLLADDGQLEHASKGRVLIEQAKGVIAQRLSLEPMEAFERLRGHALDHSRKVHEVAVDVLEGHIKSL